MMLMGLLLLGLFFVRPGVQMIRARSWLPVPCRILDSGTEFRGDGLAFRVRYRYERPGNSWTGSRFDFDTGYRSGLGTEAGLNELSSRYPPGAQTTCFVDPNDPGRSVVDRGPSWRLLWAILPLTFVLLGAWLMSMSAPWSASETI
jgi:hypothetical protein